MNNNDIPIFIKKPTAYLFLLSSIVSFGFLCYMLFVYILAVGYNQGFKGLDFTNEFKPSVIAFSISLISTIGLFKKHKIGIISGQIGIITLVGCIIFSNLLDLWYADFNFIGLFYNIPLMLIAIYAFIKIETEKKADGFTKRLDNLIIIIIPIILVLILLND